MPATLIPTDSPLYLRRLAQAVRQAIRTGAAYVISDVGEQRRAYGVTRVGGHLAAQIGNGNLVLVSADGAANAFHDGNGQLICASREPGKSRKSESALPAREAKALPTHPARKGLPRAATMSLTYDAACSRLHACITAPDLREALSVVCDRADAVTDLLEPLQACERYLSTVDGRHDLLRCVRDAIAKGGALH